MSLESLSSLKQLVEVRSQGASIQNDNLETAQRQVQQVGTGEAKRVDDLNLEKAKAEYEVALTQARVDRLQSQLERESKAVKNAEFITAGVAVLSVGSNLTNLFQDMNGAQKFADQKDGNGKFDKNGNQLVLGSDGKAARFDKDGIAIDKEKDPSGYMSGKIKVLDSKGNEVNGTFKEDDFKGRTMLGRDFKGEGSSEIIRANKGDTSGFSIYNASKVGDDGVVAITRANVSGSGGIGGTKEDPTGIRVGFVSQADIEKAGGTSFEDLMKKNPSAAEKLFEASGHRDIQRNESSIALSTIGQGGYSNVGINKDNSTVSGSNLENLKGNLIKDNEEKSGKVNLTGTVDNLKKALTKENFSEGINKRVSGYFDANGTSKGDVGAMDALKYGANAVVSIVSDVSPFYQAYLKMKDQRDKTADELQAEIAKLAAGRKRLQAIENAILSPGAGAEGSAAGAGQAAKN